MKSIIKPILFFQCLFLVLGVVVSCSSDKDVEEDLKNNRITIDFITYQLNFSNNTAEVIGHSLSSQRELMLPDIIANSLGKEFTVVSVKNGAFEKCSFISSLTIPKSVSYIGKRAFSECSTLKSAFIYGGQSIGDEAFSGCKNLRTVEIGDLAQTIGANAFSNCDALTSVQIGHAVKTIGDYAFYRDSNITSSLIIPQSVTYIGKSAFYGCSKLKSAFIYGGQSIEEEAFWGCKNLQTVEIGDLTQTIGANAFSDCDALTSVQIGHSVKTIGNYAFYGDSNIKTLTLGKSLEYIGHRCFWDDKGTWDTEYVINHIYCYAQTPPKHANDPNYPIFRAIPDKTFLHVVKGCKNAYTETWIANMKGLTVNRYPTIVEDLTKEGDIIPPSGNYFNMDYKVHTQTIGQNSNVILYQDDQYYFVINISSGMAYFRNCEVYQYGTIVQADDNRIIIEPTETVNKTQVDFSSAKYSKDRGYIIKVSVLNLATFKYEDKYINMYLSDFEGILTYPKYIHFQRRD